MSLEAPGSEPMRTRAVAVAFGLAAAVALCAGALVFLGRTGEDAAWVDGGCWALGIALAAALAAAGSLIKGNFGPVAGGLSIAVATVTGAFFLALAGAVFAMGHDGLAFALGLAAGCLLLQLIIAPRFAQTGAGSLAGLFARRYPGGFARVACALAVGLSMLTLLVAELMATGLVGSRLLGVDYAMTTAVGAVTVFACFVVRGSGSSAGDGLLFPVMLAALLVPLVMLSTAWSGVPVPQIAYGNVLAHLQGLEENLLEQELADPAYMKPMLTAFLSLSSVNFSGIVLGLALGVAALPSLLHTKAITTSTARDARWSAFWALVFVAVLLSLVPAVAAFAKWQIASLVGDRTPIANLPAWMFTYGKLGLLQICGKPATDAAAVALACAALPDPSAVLRLQDIALDPDIVTLAFPEIVGLGHVWLGLIAVAALATALVTSLGPLAAMVSSIVGDRSETGAQPRSPRLAAYGVAAAALVAAAAIAMARPASIVDVAAWSFILAAASIFPALVAALWWPRASTPGAAAAMLVGLAAALLYLLVPHFFPVPFFEATSALSNAGVGGQEYFAELKAAWLTAEPGAAKDTAWLELEAHARSLAGWWGIDKLGAALIAVPAGMVTLLLVSLVMPRRVADTAP